MNKKHAPKIGIIILAAGASTRLGQPKQLLPIGGQPLLQRIINTAIEFNTDEVTLVLGAYSELILEKISTDLVQVVHNKKWKNGMGSSLSIGVKTALQKNPQLAALIFLLSDQPFVDTSLLHQLSETFQSTNKAIVATMYNDAPSVPALFSATFFDELLQLNNHQGARQLIRKAGEQLQTIPFPKGQFDIDTMEDFQSIKQAFESEE